MKDELREVIAADSIIPEELVTLTITMDKRVRNVLTCRGSGIYDQELYDGIFLV